MRVIAYGDIMDRGQSAFTSVAKVDGPRLLVSFEGVIRVDNPYNHLRPYLDQLPDLLDAIAVSETEIDFTQLTFCNSNGFYVIMDITEIIYENTAGPVRVLRLALDDWQQETLPILIDVEDPEIATRTAFEDRDEF